MIDKEYAGDAGATCAADGHCVTCSDEALPARVLRVDPATGMAFVALEEGSAEVDITLVDAVRVGQVLLVHGGVAIGALEQS